MCSVNAAPDAQDRHAQETRLEFQRQLLLLMYELLQTAAGGLKRWTPTSRRRAKAPCSSAIRWCWKSRNCWPSSSTTSV
jgi:hypothetical protein